LHRHIHMNAKHVLSKELLIPEKKMS